MRGGTNVTKTTFGLNTTRGRPGMSASAKPPNTRSVGDGTRSHAANRWIPAAIGISSTTSSTVVMPMALPPAVLPSARHRQGVHGGPDLRQLIVRELDPVRQINRIEGQRLLQRQVV